MLKAFTFKTIIKWCQIKKSCMSNNTKIAMTGIQPSGIPHIGNFLGPIKECLRLQEDSNIAHLYLSIVDLHALTSMIHQTSVKFEVYAMAASLMACGIFGPKVSIFQQSRVHHHASLSWILMCLCPFSRVMSLPQWKEKQNILPHEETINTGYLMYPVLQAADIILYSPNIVPVGEDQIIHLELARYLRTKLLSNPTEISQALKDYFPAPELKLCKFPKIFSLRDAGKKMSKSDPNSKSRIILTDTADEIRLKIKKAVTDSDTSKVSYDVEKRPELANLIQILAAIKDTSIEVTTHGIEGLSKTQFKELLSEELIVTIEPIRKKIYELLEDRTEVDRVLMEGHESAMEKASESMNLLWQYLGLDISSDTYRSMLVGERPMFDVNFNK